MKRSDFNYHLPEHLIAKYPLKQRERARMMVLDRSTQSIRIDIFKNIGRYLPKRSVLVVNDSRVIPARLLGHKQATGGQVEIFLLRKLSDGVSFEALLRPLRRIKVNDPIVFNGGRLTARLVDRQKRIVRFNRSDIEPYLKRIGHIPLPPYIDRQDEPLDRSYYQTVYARRAGSVAAPTAGLHFTRSLIDQLMAEGVEFGRVTLHINYATFEPVQEEDLSRHRMHSESYRISQRQWQAVRRARRAGRKVVAVGTTSCRVLESVAATGRLEGETDLFIYPGFSFRMTDALLTNFHLPESTLLMMVCAFGGRDFILKAYQRAVREKFRFFSYGDCMLIV